MFVGVISLACAFFVAADDVKDKKDKAVREELEKLAGKWIQVSAEVDGEPFVLPPNSAAPMTIEGSKVVWQGQKVEYAIRINPTQNPKHWGRLLKTKDGKETFTNDIYKLEGDTLTICTIAADPEKKDSAERPKEFKTSRGSRVSIGVFKRVKE
jgi:uncharacterized protein (TIGR03067 family)